MVGWWQVSKRGGSSSERWATFTQLQVQTESFRKHLSGCVFLWRSGHGEHRWDLRGACVWSSGGHLHGGAGVCVDAASYASNRGERGLFYLPLLFVLLPALAPPSLNPPHPIPHLTTSTPKNIPQTDLHRPSHAKGARCFYILCFLMFIVPSFLSFIFFPESNRWLCDCIVSNETLWFFFN